MYALWRTSSLWWGTWQIHQQCHWRKGSASMLEGSKIPLPRVFLEFRAIKIALHHCTPLLQGYPVRVKTDNATAVAFINSKGVLEVMQLWGKQAWKPCPVTSFNISVDNWSQITSVFIAWTEGNEPFTLTSLAWYFSDGRLQMWIFWPPGSTTSYLCL